MRSIAVKFANLLGYDRLLPLLESEDTYVKVPIEIAERLGTTVSTSYELEFPSIADRTAKLKYDEDSIHTSKYLIPQVNSLCPPQCYTIEQDKVMLQHEGCIECGSCSKETDWKHP